MSWAITHCREAAVEYDPAYRCAHTNQVEGSLNNARARVRNDELLISRQARALAEAASLIRALESALGRALNAEVQPLPPVEHTSPTNPTALQTATTTEPIVEERVTVIERVVLPTVYTNVGSLIDVFA